MDNNSRKELRETAQQALAEAATQLEVGNYQGAMASLSMCQITVLLGVVMALDEVTAAITTLDLK